MSYPRSPRLVCSTTIGTVYATGAFTTEFLPDLSAPWAIRVAAVHSSQMHGPAKAVVITVLERAARFRSHQREAEPEASESLAGDRAGWSHRRSPGS